MSTLPRRVVTALGARAELPNTQGHHENDRILLNLLPETTALAKEEAAPPHWLTLAVIFNADASRIEMDHAIIVFFDNLNAAATEFGLP